VVVDDHAILRSGLRALLRGVTDVAIVGEATDGREAVDVVNRTSPDVVLMDLDMPGGDGKAATMEIVSAEGGPKVLILTMHSEEELLMPLLRAGASGFLSKDAVDQELLDAIRTVASGEVYVRPRVARMLAAGVRPSARADAASDARQRYEKLSDREQTVLRLTAQGFNGPEIGRMLGVTSKTIDTYKHRIQEKLGISHRADYVRFAITLSLLAP
jgi:DNA-binding NarL/FixJ family response regulator